jgi:predicted anti-sigma-YlaC factor YlaD
VNTDMNNDAHGHERARELIALAGSESLSVADAQSSNAWLATHLETCASCRVFAENAAETIRGLRAIPIAAERSLVSTTQMRVRQRALELQRQRERLWLVSISCTAVTLCALLSTVALWRGFAWLGERAELAPSVWQVGFLVFCVMPALLVGILLLAKGTHFDRNFYRKFDRHLDTHLADQTGSYRG